MTDQPALTQESQPSFTTLVTNVLTSPGEAFGSVATSIPAAALWAVPLVLMLLLTLGSIYLRTSNPTFREQSLNVQLASVDRMVEKGWMTAETAEKAKEEMAEKGGGSMVGESISGTVMLAIGFFVAPLILWLGAKVGLKTTAGYAKHLEIYGLSTWIGILGSVVTMILMIALDTMYASPSASLAVVSAFDPMNKTHQFLSALDIFGIWQAVVIGFGISAVAGKPSSAGIGTAFVLLAIWIAFKMVLGMVFS